MSQPPTAEPPPEPQSGGYPPQAGPPQAGPPQGEHPQGEHPRSGSSPATGYPPQDPGYPPPGQGYPPPGQGYPPPGQGYQPPAGPGYPPPGQQYPPPGQAYPPPGQQYPPPGQGYPPPGPGYPQPGQQYPQPGQGYQPPGQAYQQPGPGYPPPGQGYPPAPQGYPPAPQGGPGYPAPAGSGAGSVDFSKISTIGWGVIGATLLTFVASFFNFWKLSYGASFGSFSGGLNGWSSWWWVPVLLAIAVGVLYALNVFGILKPGQLKPELLFYGAAASFVLMIFVLIHTFVRGSGLGDLGLNSSTGPGFGVWFALITTLALTYFTALAAQSAGAKLPFKVPGPA